MKFLPYLIIVSLFTSCYQPYISQTGTATLIPSPIQNKTHVKVFVNGNEPKSGFKVLSKVEAKDYSFVSEEEMIQKLREKAFQMGANGLIVFGKSQTFVKTNLLLDLVNIANGEGEDNKNNDEVMREILGQAIYFDPSKEEKWIDINKARKGFLYLIDNEAESFDKSIPDFTFSYLENGELTNQNANTEKGATFFKEYFYPNSLEHLLLEKSSAWSFKVDDDMYIKKRKFTAQKESKIVYPQLDIFNNVSKILITSSSLGVAMQSRTIYLQYNERNQPIYKEIIISKTGEIFLEEFLYDDKGVLMSQTISRYNTKKERKPLATIVYEVSSSSKVTSNSSN